MFELSSLSWTLLALLVFFAGFVDALAGGGGLIVVPSYLALGLPPQFVLGTNKLTSSIGTSMAALQYHQRLNLSLSSFAPAITAAFSGSLAGAALALMIDPRFLRYFLILALPALVYWLYFHKHDFEKTALPELTPEQTLREVSTSFPIAAYDGFFGPGTGTFFALALNRFCHYPLLEATGRTKILNLVSNVAALATFLAAGRAHFTLGLTMGLVNMAGNYAGSRVGIQKGNRAIKPAILFVCSLLFLKTVWDIYSSW